MSNPRPKEIIQAEDLMNNSKIDENGFFFFLILAQISNELKYLSLNCLVSFED